MLFLSLCWILLQQLFFLPATTLDFLGKTASSSVFQAKKGMLPVSAQLSSICKASLDFLGKTRSPLFRKPVCQADKDFLKHGIRLFIINFYLLHPQVKVVSISCILLLFFVLSF